MAAAFKTAPRDIRQIGHRWAGCGHWAGEEPYDADRRREIDAALRALRCDRLERNMQAAKVRYRSKPDLLRALAWGIDHAEP